LLVVEITGKVSEGESLNPGKREEGESISHAENSYMRREKKKNTKEKSAAILGAADFTIDWMNREKGVAALMGVKTEKSLGGRVAAQRTGELGNSEEGQNRCKAKGKVFLMISSGIIGDQRLQLVTAFYKLWRRREEL